MRKDYLAYGVIMLILATVLAWVVYPDWSDIVTYGLLVKGFGYVILAGVILATALSIALYVAGSIVLWKGIREPSYSP